MLKNNVMSKKQFTGFLDLIEAQVNHDEMCSRAFAVLLPCDQVSSYDNSRLYKACIEMLEIEFSDEFKWIEYFIYELKFGKENNRLKAKDEHGNEIPLKNASDLYDLLVKNCT